MRKLIVTNIASIDGFYAAPDGNPLVLQMDAAFDAYNLERISTADIVLLGRDSFQMFSSYWPFVADAPVDASSPALRDDNRAMSAIYNRLPKHVVSNSLVVGEDNAWHATTTVVPRDRAAAEIGRLKAEGDGDIVVFGSHVTWNALLAGGLVDEVHVMVSPGVLGEGVPLFTGPAPMSLLGTRTFDGSGNVVLRYAPAQD
jgi:dihydrofolate reductase